MIKKAEYLNPKITEIVLLVKLMLHLCDQRVQLTSFRKGIEILEEALHFLKTLESNEGGRIVTIPREELTRGEHKVTFETRRPYRREDRDFNQPFPPPKTKSYGKYSIKTSPKVPQQSGAFTHGIPPVS